MPLLLAIIEEMICSSLAKNGTSILTFEEASIDVSAFAAIEEEISI